MYFERLKATSRTLRFRLMLWNALAGVTSFPTHDLFATFR